MKIYDVIQIIFNQLKKVKFFHTRYRALGPELIPGVQAVSPQVM